MAEAQLFNIKDIKDNEWQPHPDSPGVFVKGILSGKEGLGFKTAYVKILPGCELLPHTHDVTEVFYFISGTGSLLLNGERVECGEGSVVVAPAGVEHGTKNETGQEIYLLANFKA